MHLLKTIKVKYFTPKISKTELNNYLLEVIKEKQDMINELKSMIEGMVEFDLTVDEYLKLEEQKKETINE